MGDVDRFLSALETYVNNVTANAKSTLGFESGVSISFANQSDLAKRAKGPLTKALVAMETEKENIARDHNQSREVYAKGSGISTGDAQKFLADLADPTNIPNVKTPYAITAKPSKLRAFVTKLKNAREFVDVEVESNAVDSWRDPTRGFHGLYRKGGDVGGRKSRKLGNKFNRCVKSVRSTVRARKGSNKESAAIAICTTSVLHPRGRTIKRYRKKRLVTQRKFRGGNLVSCS